MKKIILILLLTLIPTLSHAGFSVHKDGIHQTQIPYNQAVALDWGYEEWDTNNEFDLNTGEFCPTTSGVYTLTLGVHWKNMEDGSKLCAGFQVSRGGDYERSNYICQFTYGKRKHGIPVPTLLYLNTGDCVMAGIVQKSRSNRTFILGYDADTWFKGELLR